ncbi:DUF899 family protein [Sphingosinicella terrae]|uniref:DUF899 family protein n=1 Tax=Sphingosinicella terrae TaxID=2172047 RepID=UPI000E0CD775|nr:DUF899 family protein [Sphingosinicella terrae]
MADHPGLVPAAELAAGKGSRFPNESADYREARKRLLAEEIELRRHIERVAAQRRRLPPGGEVLRDYRFVGEAGPVTLADLFGRHDSLIIYNYMFGPQREKPCPMCTSFMAALESKVRDITQRVGLAMIARSPIDRLVEAKQARGWTELPVYSDSDGDFTRDYVSAADEDVPGYTVFTRRDGTIRHFWSAEMDMSDPGQDPRGAPDLDPLWTLLDTVPEGRGSDWYPKLSYD